MIHKHSEKTNKTRSKMSLIRFDSSVMIIRLLLIMELLFDSLLSLEKINYNYVIAFCHQLFIVIGYNVDKF